MRLLCMPLGADGGEDVLIVGSQEAHFPREDDRLLLSVGANQAGIVLRHWRAEKLLKESEALSAEAQRLASVGSWNWNISSNKVQWSDEQYRIFGLEPQAQGLPHDQVMSSIHSDD